MPKQNCPPFCTREATVLFRFPSEAQEKDNPEVGEAD